MKKKLLITTDTYYPKKDGVMIFLEKIVPSLTEEFDVTIAAPVFDIKKIKRIGKARVVGFPISKRIKIAGYNGVKFSRKNRKKLKQLVRESDIVWSQDLAFLGAFSIYYGKKYRKPVFNYVHQITWEQSVDVFSIPNFSKRILSMFIRKGVNYLYNKCTVLMIPYKELAAELEQKGVGAKKIVIPLGVDSDEFKPPRDKFLAKKEIGFNPKEKIVGYCGRISKEKNLNTLKKAFIRLKEDIPGVKLLIVGSGPKEQIGKLKEVPGVRITGFVKNVVPYLQAMDVFVMPSLTETTSLATLEAMSCKLSVIATKVGHIKDYIRHKFNGMFFGKENDYILRRRLELLLNDQGLRHIIGNNARKTVEEKFSWNRTRRDVKKALGMF